MQRLDHAHREARREAPADARRDQAVADPDVGALRDVGQAQLVGAAGAEGDGAQARPDHLHRNGVVGVGEQQRRGAARRHFDHLAQHAAGINHGLPHRHAAVAAGVEQDALARGVEVNVDDAHQLGRQAVAAGAAEQFAQALVFLGHRQQAMQAAGADLQFAGQPLVLGGQLLSGAEQLAHALGHAAGRCGHPPHGLGQHRQLQPGLAGEAAALVGDHQGHRQREIGQQRQGATGTFTQAGRGGTGIGHLVFRERPGVTPARRTRCRAGRSVRAHGHRRAPRR